MKLKQILFSLTLVFMTFICLSNVAADSQSAQIKKIQDSGVLKVGVKQDVPNFGYYSAESDKYEGMEIDIARKIAKSPSLACKGIYFTGSVFSFHGSSSFWAEVA